MPDQRMADQMDRQSPCVLMLGWQGCQLRHLQKYAAGLWQKLGFRCVLFVDHSLALPFVGPSYATIVNNAASLLEQHSPTCVHVFSNGGGLLWRQLIVLARTKPRTARALGSVTHVVYDSTPGDMFPCSPLGLPRGFRFGFSFLWEFFRSPLARLVVVASAPAMAVLTVLLWVFGLQFIRRFNMSIRYHNDLVEGIREFKYRNLFLFSEDDKLVDYQAVTRVVKQARSIGAEVTSQSWKTSTHVRHFQEHEEDYLTAVRDFTKPAVRESPSKVPLP